MKHRWVIVGFTIMALIFAGIVFRAQRNHRRWAKSAAVYRIRAEQGDAKSQLQLGSMYYYGKGVSKNYVEAVRWYRKSAEQGNPKAEYSLCDAYHEGRGVPQGLRRSSTLVSRSCRSERCRSSIRPRLSVFPWGGHCTGLLGSCPAAGSANPPSRVMRWLNTRSAIRISAGKALHGITRKLSAGIASPLSRVMRKAQYALGYMYYYGYGVPRDRAGANDLFQKAAAQDDEDGKRALECLRKGISIDPGAGLSGLQ